ncbi:hypothetical protein PIB30_080836, partial [Stylosanthes scabra]|nr:hypothetical protein [Stylosanthes scabra]
GPWKSAVRKPKPLICNWFNKNQFVFNRCYLSAALQNACHLILCFAAVVPAIMKNAAKPFSNAIIDGGWVTATKSFGGG